MISYFLRYHFETLQVDNVYGSRIPQWECPHKNSEGDYEGRGFWDPNYRNLSQQKKYFGLQYALKKFCGISTLTSETSWYSNQLIKSMNKCSVSNKPHFICNHLIIYKVSSFYVNESWWGCFMCVSSLSDLCLAGNVDDLLDDVTGLVDFCLVTASDDSSNDVSDESSEDNEDK